MYTVDGILCTTAKYRRWQSKNGKPSSLRLSIITYAALPCSNNTASNPGLYYHLSQVGEWIVCGIMLWLLCPLKKHTHTQPTCYMEDLTGAEAITFSGK